MKPIRLIPPWRSTSARSRLAKIQSSRKFSKRSLKQSLAQACMVSKRWRTSKSTRLCQIRMQARWRRVPLTPAPAIAPVAHRHLGLWNHTSTKSRRGKSLSLRPRGCKAPFHLSWIASQSNRNRKTRRRKWMAKKRARSFNSLWSFIIQRITHTYLMSRLKTVWLQTRRCSRCHGIVVLVLLYQTSTCPSSVPTLTFASRLSHLIP